MSRDDGECQQERQEEFFDVLHKKSE